MRAESEMDRLTTLIESDPVSLMLAIVVFLYVGHRAVRTNVQLRNWGNRLALGAFVAYAFYASTKYGIDDPRVFVGIAFRSLFAAGLALGISWIGFAVLSIIVGKPWMLLRGRLRDHLYRRNLRRREEQRTREEAERLRLAREHAERMALIPKPPMGPTEADLKREQDKHRRDDAKLRCQMLYDRHQVALANHFSRERLNEYLKTHLSDAHSADRVEERARLLESLLQQILESASRNNGTKFRSFNEIADYFRARREDLVRAGYPDDVCDSLETDIAEQEQAAIREFLKP